MNRIDARKAVPVGSFGAAIVFVPLGVLAAIAAGSAECSDCGADRFLVDALLLSAIYAASFGLIAGCIAAVLKPALDRRIHPIGATLLLSAAVALLAIPTVQYAPRLYVYAEYLRTPRDELPPTDPRHRPSDCSKRKLPPNVACAH